MTGLAVPDFTRRSGKNIADPSRRSATHRDRDRILYSEAFRRLAGVTQVALGSPAMILHNRLTHSLKVEQVGIAIHSKLAGENGGSAVADEYAIAAACLAHDIGHPPFGHAGEQELHAIATCHKHRDLPRTHEARQKDPCKTCLLEDGFEGNAQSFRILAALAVHKDTAKHPQPIGLDLARVTLRASTKYPWARGDNEAKPNKWGAYDCDLPALKDISGDSSELSLEAEIMDWADDITYAVHDVEDFYRTHHLPLEQYSPDSQALLDFLEYAESPAALGPLEANVKEALKELLFVFPRTRFSATAIELASLDNARGTLLTQFINGATLDSGRLSIDKVQKRLNSLVKQFVWFHVIDGPDLTNIQAGQRRVLREIFKALKKPALLAFKVGVEGDPDERDLRRLPFMLRRCIEVAMDQESEYTQEQRVYRGLLDYISSLSDADAYHQHAVLKGRELFGQLNA